MPGHSAPFLTADDLRSIAHHVERAFTDSQHEQARSVLSDLPELAVDLARREGAGELAATVMVRLNAAGIDTDVLIRGVELQLRLVGYPVAYRGLLITVLEQLVDTGLDFRLSTEELIDRAAPLITQTI